MIHPRHSAQTRSILCAGGRDAVFFAILLAFILCAAGCASSGSKGSSSTAPERPIEDLVAATKKPESIGKFLADVNQAIKAWNNLFLDAQSDAERSRARLLETHLTTVTHQRREEIIRELESGPLNNRIVAAAALGFTHDVEAQSPLIAALSDQHEEVIANALFGLWLLGRTDTPIETVCPLFSTRYGDNVRTHASLLLTALTKDGASAPCALSAARLGLLDPTPEVRVHSALILANLKDSESVQAIVDRLTDDEVIVVSAAARTLVYLGTEDPHQRGVAARALVKAWITAKDPEKTVLSRSLVELADVNYGSNEEEWAKWASRLP
jgi:hypothetical protein